MKDLNKFEDLPEILDDDYFIMQDNILYGFGNPYSSSNNEILCEDFTTVPLGHCRRCKEPMEKHESIYFKDDSDYEGQIICKWVYSYRTGYCPHCILEESQKIRKPKPKIPIHELIRDLYGDVTEERVTYPDGEVVGLSWSEPKHIILEQQKKEERRRKRWQSQY